MDPEFAALAQTPDPEINLAEGALLIAREHYPDLDCAYWLGYLDELGELAAARMPERGNWTEQITVLNRLLFQELGFTGSDVDTFDPRDSFLNDVLTRKSGIPITLSVVFMEVGRRAGLDIQGISFPGHFLVKMAVEDGEVVIDPYNAGLLLSLDQLQGRLEAVYPDAPRDMLEDFLQGASNKQILARILRNLKTWYLHQEEWNDALSALNRILLLEPDNLVELRERGELYQQLECFRAAHTDLSRYLSLTPPDEETDNLRVTVAELRQQVARLN